MFDPGGKFGKFDPNPNWDTACTSFCQFGHQWKYDKFCNYAIIQSRKFTGFRRCHNNSHWLQVRRFRNPVSISLITLQCARAEYELAKLAS